MKTETAVVRVESKKEYDKLCELINYTNYVWGYEDSSYVLLRINEEGAKVITCALTKHGFSWIESRAGAQHLKVKSPISFYEFTSLYLAYRLTGDTEVFKC